MEKEKQDLLDAIPSIGERKYPCWKNLDGTRDACNPGLCCGKSWIKNDEVSTIKEHCYKDRITLYTETVPGENGAEDKTEYWKFECIENAKSLAVAAFSLLTAVIIMN